MKRLLIVEDKESLALMLKETVESEGLEADTIANGSDAIRRLAALHEDCPATSIGAGLTPSMVRRTRNPFQARGSASTPAPSQTTNVRTPVPFEMGTL